MDMPLPPDARHDDDQLVRYLLGALPEDETQRVEEDSLVDDEVAARLRLVEDDLVDAYARGNLTGDRLVRFEAFYLASPGRRQKMEFARRLLAAIDSAAPRPEPKAPARPQAAGRWSPWMLAAAAAVLLTTGVLLVQDTRLRRDVTDARASLAAAEQRVKVVSGQLDDHQRAAAAAIQALANARGPQPEGAVALVLMPQTRGLDRVSMIAVPRGARTVPLDLTLEAANNVQYSVALRDPASNGIVWRSQALASESGRRPPVVPVRVPASLLKAQHYALDLFELRAGAPEFVGSYAFEVVHR
jgi:hypothetical protein